MANTPEGKVKRAISKALNRLGAYYFMPVQNGMGHPSIDYLVCYRGHFIGIEAKAPGKTPTQRQWATMEHMRNAGAVTIIIDSVEAAKNLEATLLLCLGDHGREGKMIPQWNPVNL